MNDEKENGVELSDEQLETVAGGFGVDFREQVDIGAEFRREVERDAERNRNEVESLERRLKQRLSK